MRGRLLRSSLAVALSAVLALGLPLVVVARSEVWSSARSALRGQAVTVATAVEDRVDVGSPVDLSVVVRELPGRRITLRRPGAPTQVAGGPLQGRVLTASAVLSGASVEVAEPRGPTAARARDVTLLVLGLALLAVGVSVALAVAQSRLLARPLDDLARQADALGREGTAATVVSSGIVEVDRISRDLDRSGRRITELLQRQRDVAGDAAHQLRTPLTGIGLRLEEVIRLGDATVAAEAEAALAQVERLDGVITTLLARARDASEAARDLDLSEVVREETAVWQRVLQQRRRPLHLETGDEVVVHARRDHVVGVMTSLLDNALAHGAGAVRVRCRATGGGGELSVSDEGPGIAAALAGRVFDRDVSGGRGTGIGLRLAAELADADGGRLQLSEPRTAEFTLSLPRATRPGGTPT